MNKIIIPGLVAAACVGAVVAKDDIVMTVNGVDVPLSEFEYLYNKNNRQQIDPQPLDKYVDMFTLYKLKVADAKSEGIDTTGRFRQEIENYRNEVAAPFMADSVYIKSLVDEAFRRTETEAEGIHITKLKRKNDEDRAVRASLDSIRELIVSGKITFEDAARQNSEDKASAGNGGNMGYISATLYPIEFEEAVFSLPEGEVSPVFETRSAYHIVKGGKKRPARGKVVVNHILKLVPQGASEEEQKKIRQEIDSIYNVVSERGTSFEVTAAQVSDDKASARRGGMLEAFMAGQMVNQFDSVSFALKDFEISKPFRTPYGWHIVRRVELLKPESYEKRYPMLLAMVTDQRDPRSLRIREQQSERLAKKHNARIMDNVIDGMKKYIDSNNVDSLFFEKYVSGPDGKLTAMVIDGRKIPVSEMLSRMVRRNFKSNFMAQEKFNDYVRHYWNYALTNAEMVDMEKNDPAFRNLVKEYTDGSLLYEVSLNKVWDKASKDRKGLEKYFADHRNDYKWKQPKAKCYIIQAIDDSVGQKVRELMDRTGKDSLVNTVRKYYGGSSTINLYLMAKGENKMVDYLVFDGPKARSEYSNYKCLYAYDVKIIDEPECVDDVLGSVTSDYQNHLENIWITELRGKYPVKINKKVLKKVK